MTPKRIKDLRVLVGRVDANMSALGTMLDATPASPPGLVDEVRTIQENLSRVRDTIDNLANGDTNGAR